MLPTKPGKNLQKENTVKHTFLTLFVSGAALMGQVQRPPAGSVAPLPAPDARGAVQAAIAASTLTVAGRAFPKVALANAKTQSCCNIGDVHSVDVAKIALHGPKNDKKGAPTPPAPIEAVYSPPGGCWVVQAYTRVTMSAAGAYQAWDDAQPANFNYNTSTVYNQELSSLKNYVGSLNIPDYVKADLNIKLEEFVKNYSSYANSISTSSQQVRHRAQTYGRGLFNGSSWYEGYLNVKETCCPPEVRDPAALRQTLRAWVDGTVAKIRFVNQNKVVNIL